MARHTPLDLPGDFDEQLRRALAVEPSPEFLPRVRARISTQPQSAVWGWGLPLTATTIAAACVAGFVLSARLAPVAAPAAPGAPARNHARAVEPRPVPEGAVLAIATRPAVPVARPVRAAPGAADHPAVLIDERQRAAFVLLARLVRDGTLTDEAFARTRPQSLDAIEKQIVPVDVTPVTVSPLGVDGVLQK
jgi:hypothetical protein